MTRPFIALFAALLLIGCSGPTVMEGPRLRVSPEGYLSEIEKARRLIENAPENVIIHHDADIMFLEPDILYRPYIKAMYIGEPTGKPHYDLSKFQPYVVDGVVIYDTDLTRMKFVTERMASFGKRYGYREEAVVVPYGFCIDFIATNLGTVNDSGYVLNMVECSQVPLLQE